MDCVLLEHAGGLPRALVEYKKPAPSEGGSGARRLSLLVHSAQAINYGSQLMFQYPEIGVLPIIITMAGRSPPGTDSEARFGPLLLFFARHSSLSTLMEE